MKKHFSIIVSLALMTCVFTPSLAKTFEDKVFSHAGWNERTKIKKEELPESARKTLDGDAFKGWTMAAAYKTTEGEYEVDMKKGDSVQTIKFDKDGKLK